VAEERRGGQRPHGRDEIVASVVEAATELFSARGPASVSLRDVAAAARVTLSQIHRHIGNKEALLAAVLAADLAAGEGPAATAGDLELAAWLKLMFRRDLPARGRTRLHGQIILDGYDLPELQRRYPGVELTVRLLGEALPDEQARVRAALLTAFFGGWQLFGPTYLRVTGADGVGAERFAEIIGPLLDALATAPPGPND
jgi:TetR/AcrR family transcriptional regulator, repressor for neighboring sulfatase